VTVVAATGSVEGTRDLGAALAELLRPGDVLVLTGDLGAGKTALTQGLGRGLGVTAPITSPTFTLAQVYEGRLRMHHLDVYRLERPEEALDLGLPELLDDEGVVVVEWGEAILAELPADHLEVRLTFGAGDDDRRIAVRANGRRWVARERSLAAALAPWVSAAPEAEPC
jgi:tRNA threonylcarbamoyladenosine biosynthesis protein TsaE